MASHITPSGTAISGETLPTDGLTYGPYSPVDYSKSKQVQAAGAPANGGNGAITWDPAPVTRWMINFNIGDDKTYRFWEFDTEAHRDAELVLIKTALTT